MLETLAYLLLNSGVSIRGESIFIQKFKATYVLLFLLLLLVLPCELFATGAVIERVLSEGMEGLLRKVPKSTWAEIRAEGLSVAERQALFRSQAALIFAKQAGRIEDDVLMAITTQLKKSDELARIVRSDSKFFSSLSHEAQEALILLAKEETIAAVQGQSMRLLRTQSAEFSTAVRETVDDATRMAAKEVHVIIVPELMDAVVIRGVQASEKAVAAAAKVVPFKAVLPEFKISSELLSSDPMGWVSLLVKEGDFAAMKVVRNDRGAAYFQFSSELSGGMDLAVTRFEKGFHGQVQELLQVEFTHLLEASTGKATYVTNKFLYSERGLFRWLIETDAGQVLLDRTFHP